MPDKTAAPRKLKIGTWGERFSSSQLVETLQSNRSEVLELCRRITCDENAAANLMSLVESYLNEADNRDVERTLSGHELDRTTTTSNPVERSVLSVRSIEVEINLIQLLAELHSVSLSQLRK